MGRYWPLVLIAAGLLLVVFGFAYDVMYAGIPYQDPPPEIAAEYARQAGIASTIRLFGAGFVTSGLVACVIVWMSGRSRS
jgi:protein-S-isoprenylcysteine O-methyltransferase Ste14